MKVLVLQLARLGDIYQTWPVLRALKRTHPSAEIHLLTRSKFSGAAPKEGCVDRHWLLDTREVLSPLIDEKPAIDSSLEKLERFCAELRAEGFDRVVNLTFSPFSSYLAREVATPERTQVFGYTRFDDGYLSIPDDGSAYFYAQVGIDRPNRLHVTDLFAHVAGVELTEEDWKVSVGEVAGAKGKILVHVGASSQEKTLSWSKWLQVVKQLLDTWSGEVVLIGAKEEQETAEKIAAVSGPRTPVNLVGKTSLDELFALVAEAKLLIGGDSGPVQIASLTNTPVLNVSLPIVSFWETGPRSKGSRILPIANEEAVSSEEIANEAIAILEDKPSRLPIVRVPGRTFPYVETRPQPMAFEWELLRAMYMGDPFPAPPSELFLVGLQRLADVNQLAQEQIHALRRNHGNKTASAILDRCDEIMDQVSGMVPEVAPIVRWFRTERMRIGPGPVARIIELTDSIHRRLGDVISLYNDSNGTVQSEERER